VVKVLDHQDGRVNLAGAGEGERAAGAGPNHADREHLPGPIIDVSKTRHHRGYWGADKTDAPIIPCGDMGSRR
jgi:hypothetical protein